MRAECHFAKAGQGLFYNGILYGENRAKFTFVYDCGTHQFTRRGSSALRKSITDFRDIMGKRLDLLFISHFDRDHISHIPELIDGKQLGTVVIPYIDLDMRVLITSTFFPKYIEDNDDVENEDRNDLIDFVQNPIRFFRERGAEKIIILYGNDENAEDPNEVNFPPSPKPDSPPSSVIDKGDLYKENDSKNVQSDDTNESGVEIIKYGRFAYIIACHFAWEFKTLNPYIKQIDNERLRVEFSEILQKYDIKKRRSAFSNSDCTIELRRLYKKYFAEINESSLIVRSRPLTKYRQLNESHSSQPCQFYTNCGCKCLYCDYDLTNNSFNHGDMEYADTLLTGDISLNSHIADCLRTTYRGMFDFYTPQIMLIPHHGSKTSIHDDWCSRVSYCLGNVRTSLVLSYGRRNTFNHPDIRCFWRCPSIEPRQQLKLRSVNEEQDFSYTVFFYDTK